MKTDSEDRNDDGRPSAKTEDRAVVGHSADTVTRGDDTVSPCDDGASRSEEGGRQPAIKTDPIKVWLTHFPCQKARRGHRLIVAQNMLQIQI